MTQTKNPAGSALMTSLLGRVVQEPNWDDHQKNFEAVAQELISSLELTEVLHSSIIALEASEEIAAEAKILYEGNKASIDRLVDEIEIIKAKHSGRTGAVIEADMADYLEIGTFYIDLHHRITATVSPINLQLTGLQSEAGMALKERVALEEKAKQEAVAEEAKETQAE